MIRRYYIRAGDGHPWVEVSANAYLTRVSVIKFATPAVASFLTQGFAALYVEVPNQQEVPS